MRPSPPHEIHLRQPTNTPVAAGNVRKILVRGSMPACRPRRRKFRKFDYEMVHSEVYLNKYVVSIAPFSTPVCPDCSQNITKTWKTVLFCMFSLFNFSFIFPGESADPICLYVRTPMISLYVHFIFSFHISFILCSMDFDSRCRNINLQHLVFSQWFWAQLW